MGAKIWTDDPNGLSVDLKAINTPDIGTAANPIGTLYAQAVSGATISEDTLTSPDGLSSIQVEDAETNINLPTGIPLYINVNGVPTLVFNGTALFPNTAGALTIGAALNPFDAGYFDLLRLTAAANGKAGTVTLNGATPVVVGNTSITAGSVVIFTLKTVGGTVGAYPAIQTITPATGFTVQGTAADTSVYNYAVIETA